jgi:hypothetical protein
VAEEARLVGSISKIWRAWRRREMSDVGFQTATDAVYAAFDERDAGTLVGDALNARLDAILEEAKRSPPAPVVLPPLPADEVDVSEVMVLFRRVIAGEITVRTDVRWTQAYHDLGRFTIDGWWFAGFRRDWGIKHIVEALSPDKQRQSTWKDFEAREGNPFSLLTDDEQEAFCKLLEGEL